MKLLSLLSALVLALALLAASRDASAVSAGDLNNLRVIGHHYTTFFSNGKRTASVKKPSEGRYLVLKLDINVPSDDSKIFTNDFVLQYFHKDGKEDRNKCTAICRAKTAKLSENDGCAIGNAAWVLLGKSNKYLTLVFYLESDVDSVKISRTGTQPLTYIVGSDRPYSVYIATNQGQDALSKAEKVISAGGYQVVGTGTSLTEEKKGITIHYAESAEVQAREISQRIMTELGVAPEVKKMKLISDNDIIVWITG